MDVKEDITEPFVQSYTGFGHIGPEHRKPNTLGNPSLLGPSQTGQSRYQAMKTFENADRVVQRKKAELKQQEDLHSAEINAATEEKAKQGRALLIRQRELLGPSQTGQSTYQAMETFANADRVVKQNLAELKLQEELRIAKILEDRDKTVKQQEELLKEQQKILRGFGGMVKTTRRKRNGNKHKTTRRKRNGNKHKTTKRKHRNIKKHKTTRRKHRNIKKHKTTKRKT